MKYYLLIILLLTMSLSVFGQSPSDGNDNYKYEILEVPAEFEGGIAGFYKYIADSLKYPDLAVTNGIEGQVFVQFVIDESGKILEESIKIERSPHILFSEETIRLIRNCPDWIPGQKVKGGPNYRMKMMLPVTFMLDKKSKKKKSRKKRKRT